MSTRNGRVALVTGGANGFGQAIARRLAQDGHAIAVADLVDADETERMLQDTGAPFLSVKTDITSIDEVRALAATVESTLGPVDVLVANAGIYPIIPFFETSWAVWRQVMDVNVDSMYHLFQTFVPGMVDRRWGRVLAMVSGAFNKPPPGMAPYAASKGAVHGLVRGLSEEVGHAGVTVNAIAPPLAATPGALAGPQREMGIFDMAVQLQVIKRPATAEDITGIVSFAVSDDAEFVSGQTLSADGGMQHTG